MAYIIIGALSEEERKELRRRGWELESVPRELMPPLVDTGLDVEDFVMVFVDADMFAIMDGEDWE